MELPRDGTFTFGFTLISASNLTAKDLNGKSDPYAKVGLVGLDGSSWFMGNPQSRPATSSTVKETLNPVWKSRNAFSFIGDYSKTKGFKIQLWDEDFIGSDEFLGEAIWTWDELVEDQFLNAAKRRELEKQLQSRPGKKDKISGSVKIGYNYLSQATRARIIREEKEKQQEERQAKHDSFLEQLLQQAPQLSSNNSTEVLARLQKLATNMASWEKPFITEKKILMQVLMAHDVWTAVTSYSAWEGRFRDASEDPAQSPDVKSKQDQIMQMQQDAAWMLFDSNGDGKIDFEELAAALAVLLTGSSPERDAFLFDIFDKDKNGSLDLQELTRIFAVDIKMMFTIFFASVERELAQANPGKTAELRETMEAIRALNFVEKSQTVVANDFAQRLAEKRGKEFQGVVSREDWMALSAEGLEIRAEISERVGNVLSGLFERTRSLATGMLKRKIEDAARPRYTSGGGSGGSRGRSYSGGGGSSYGGGGWDSD